MDEASPATLEHSNHTEEAVWDEDPCAYEQPPLTDFRFWLVTVFGSTVSVVSVFENLLLFYIFTTRKHHHSSHSLYMLFLSFFDFFVSMAYLFLMSLNVLSDYLRSPTLLKLWFSYMVPMLTISHVAMSSGSFLIVTASFERFAVTLNQPYMQCVQRNRKWIVSAAIFLALISKGTICIEFNISTDPRCVGEMTEVQLQYTYLVTETPYNAIWRFWYRSIMTVFFPFFMLSYFNFRIVRTLTRQQQMSFCVQLAGNLAMEQAKRKAVARAATRTLVLVATCYLVSNIINVFLTIWEFIDRDSLGNYPRFYAICIDLVSLLTTLACACRLPIYLVCQPQIRKEVVEVLSSLCPSFCPRRKHLQDSQILSEETQCVLLSSAATVQAERLNGSVVLGSHDGETKVALMSPDEDESSILVLSDFACLFRDAKETLL